MKLNVKIISGEETNNHEPSLYLLLTNTETKESKKLNLLKNNALKTNLNKTIDL